MPDDEDDGQSLALPPRDYSDIAKLQDPTVLNEFLEQPLTFIAETITGALAVGKVGAMVAGGRIVQALLKGRAFKQWAKEFGALRDAGRIPDDFAESKNGFQTWVELMTVIDEDRPDADRLEALKAMFYAMNKTSATDAERIQAYQLWQIAKELKSGELQLLGTIHRLINNLAFGDYKKWAEYIALESGFGVPEMVELYEKRLLEMLLLTPRFRVSGDGPGPHTGIQSNNGRLTVLGLKFCKNIETYQIDLKAADKN
jgi:hypothetical protein